MRVWTVTAAILEKQTGETGFVALPANESALSLGVAGTAAGRLQPGSPLNAAATLGSAASVAWSTMREGSDWTPDGPPCVAGKGGCVEDEAGCACCC